ncbi:MAG: septum formation protein Maf [Verrucomicrobia bacterium]|nr:MAG: septum formation protein Maf [Verrucomicrobiota bacterium]TAE87650.1 MAG: septum formation protein Maf [Verrucomicrobiota bacterium]TAF25415.1 MAG: septum formation protein Maf [Verrucomicrobiota bacterium]TAF41202.1 MAG: septum formation protein Maf [Verrucomicrobiota bacterium]
MRLILASGSPRRRDLLAAAGVAFEVVVSPAEELHDASIPLAELCERNAALKAGAVAVDFPDAVVVGADTLVWIDGEPLGKPRDLDEARVMLRKLSGRSHTVCTGVCVIFPDGRSENFHELTAVRFRDLDEAGISAYFERTNPLDKAGAYGIQDSGEMIVEGIDGAFDNVMGLPVAAVMARLAAG